MAPLIDRSSTGAPDIYAYTDYRVYLRDQFSARRRKKDQFSFGRFARKAGLATKSTPKMVVDGKRRLTIESARKFSYGLDLDKRQTAYFEALVEFEQANDAKKKAAAIAKIKSLRPRHKTVSPRPDQMEYLTDPRLIALREMLHLKNFKEDPRWISRAVSPPISATEVKSAFAKLAKLGLIKRNENGKLVPSDPVITTDLKVSDVDVFPLHRSLLAKASDTLATVGGDKRYHAALTFPVPLRKMEEIQKRIFDFQRSLIELVDDGKNDFDEVFHLSVALFPATDAKGRTT